MKVRPHHLYERPPLQVRALHRRIENNPRAACCKPHPELDVLDRRHGESHLVEAADALKGVAADSPDAGPEGRRRAGGGLMDMVVKEIAEDGHEARGGRRVIVRAKERDKFQIGGKRITDPLEGVGVNLDIGVNEYEDVSGRPSCTGVPRCGWTGEIGVTHYD